MTRRTSLHELMPQLTTTPLIQYIFAGRYAQLTYKVTCTTSTGVGFSYYMQFVELLIVAVLTSGL